MHPAHHFFIFIIWLVLNLKSANLLNNFTSNECLFEKLPVEISSQTPLELPIALNEDIIKKTQPCEDKLSETEFPLAVTASNTFQESVCGKCLKITSGSDTVIVRVRGTHSETTNAIYLQETFDLSFKPTHLKTTAEDGKVYLLASCPDLSKCKRDSILASSLCPSIHSEELDGLPDDAYRSDAIQTETLPETTRMVPKNAPPTSTFSARDIAKKKPKTLVLSSATEGEEEQEDDDDNHEGEGEGKEDTESSIEETSSKALSKNPNFNWIIAYLSWPLTLFILRCLVKEADFSLVYF